MLAQGHDVDVVVDEDRPTEGRHHVARHVVVIPAGHDRGQHRSPGGVLDRARQPDPDTGQVGPAAAGALEQGTRRPGHLVEHGLGPSGDVEGQGGLVEDASAQVGQGDECVGGADVDTDDDSGVGVECQPGRWAPTGGGRLARGGEQPGGQERIDPSTHRGPRQPRHPDQFGPGPRGSVEHQLQQFACP